MALPDAGSDSGAHEDVRYHLELEADQLKVTWTALRIFYDDLGHDEHDVRRVVGEVLAKLPDEHSVRAIRLGEG